VETPESMVWIMYVGRKVENSRKKKKIRAEKKSKCCPPDEEMIRIEPSLAKMPRDHGKTAKLGR